MLGAKIGFSSIFNMTCIPKNVRLATYYVTKLTFLFLFYDIFLGLMSICFRKVGIGTCLLFGCITSSLGNS